MIFGSKDNLDEKKADDDVTPQQIEALAAQAEVEALVKRDSRLADYWAEHERDCSTYKFECRRWGDFLSLFIERRIYEWEEGDYSFKTHAASVNIRETRTVTLNTGNEPDLLGTLVYRAQLRSDGGGSAGWGTGYGRAPAPEGFHYEILEDYQRAGPWQIFVLDPEPTGNEFRGVRFGLNDYQPRHVTQNYARPATDDAVRFEGIRATLFVPAGRGQPIYEQILREIGDYADRKAKD